MDVVLRLGFGEAERIDLHAIAEPTGTLVSHAITLETDPVPQLGERTQLADLLHEADARVHEERDRAVHLLELRRLHLT